MSEKDVTKITCSALFVFAAIVTHGDASAELDPEVWLREAEAANDCVTSYTAVFYKQQRVFEKLLPEETILLKCKKKPFSLYMKWIKAPTKVGGLLSTKMLRARSWCGFGSIAEMNRPNAGRRARPA